jgi:hypothetical protein
VQKGHSMKRLAIACLMVMVFTISAPVKASATRPKTAQTEMHVVGQCAFRIPKTPGVRFEMDKDSDSGGFGVGHTGDPDFWAVQMACKSLSPDLLETMVGVQRDGNTYVLGNQKERFIKEQNTKLILLNGVNWTGAGTITDSTTGELFDRYRRLNFCLVRGSRALCGWSNVVAHLSAPKKNVLKKVLRILNSIEFVDDSWSSAAISRTRRSDGDREWKR